MIITSISKHYHIFLSRNIPSKPNELFNFFGSEGKKQNGGILQSKGLLDRDMKCKQFLNLLQSKTASTSPLAINDPIIRCYEITNSLV